MLLKGADILFELRLDNSKKYLDAVVEMILCMIELVKRKHSDAEKMRRLYSSMIRFVLYDSKEIRNHAQ